MPSLYVLYCSSSNNLKCSAHKIEYLFLSSLQKQNVNNMEWLIPWLTFLKKWGLTSSLTLLFMIFPSFFLPLKLQLKKKFHLGNTKQIL